MLTGRPGPLNLITDVAGLLVGNAADDALKSGVTVVLGTGPFAASVDVMGGAPGTRETDLLRPGTLVDRIDALVLSGGSAFGLSAADGAMAALRGMGRGWPVGDRRVPIVPAAILYDLASGGTHDWTDTPYPAMGRAAVEAAGTRFALGTEGAGTGAVAGCLKGGLGSASLVLDGGVTVGALVAANPVGGVACPETGRFRAAPFELDGEFGSRGAPASARPETRGAPPGTATTIAIVATDAALDKAQAQRVAVMAQDGMARAILPSHTPFDGDLVFAASTLRRPAPDAAGLAAIGHAASVCLARAIARGVFHARRAPGDPYPCWSDRWG
ncbi:hypothetical protein OCGS_1207 [Oceaniovalibus guishaninsula JLT2003]|uniref:Uncharacterized protein n=1 Tax=Oceaniovalibus guishaninsula JLT2003 TaxID=1231392 RepID=K2HNC4_9RHOB|nr:P1 family peptidase [Oceaniovalibus guishaninsula]EKE44369.1 hypothetical protein OCGS_1207 [Oceaniovalibus guishaninsula JLT2003]